MASAPRSRLVLALRPRLGDAERRLLGLARAAARWERRRGCSAGRSWPTRYPASERVRRLLDSPSPDDDSDHVPVRLRPRRRLRRRVPRRHGADRARRRASSTSRHGDRRATTCAPARSSCAARCPTARPACTSRSSTPRSAASAVAVAVRTAEDDRILVGPDNGLLSLAVERFGGAVEAVDVGALAAPPRAGVGDLPRPRHLRAGRRARSRPARRSPTRATRSTPTSSSPLHMPLRPRARTAASSPTRWPSTASATSCSTSSTRSWPRSGLKLGHRVHDQRRARASTRRRSPTSRPASCCSTRTPTGRSRWP